MAIPAGYAMTMSGFYAKSDDNSVGYSISSAGTPTFLGVTQISATSVGYSQGATGLWFGADGSGPFFRNSAGQIYSIGV